LQYRKVEGEGKGDGHGGPGSGFRGPEVPMRRWEDWERSRLRKLKREERRRRDFARAHPGGYMTRDGDLLSVRGMDARSQYDGSDAFSVTSSDDDHWGPQIGGYNENHAQYPPPPVALLPPRNQLQSAKTVDGAELEAMLESGFDERPTPPTSTYAPRYQLSDTGSTVQLASMNGNGYAPLTRASSPGLGIPPPNMISPTSPTITMSGEPPRNAPGGQHSSVGRYGPLGPLDPGTRF